MAAFSWPPLMVRFVVLLAYVFADEFLFNPQFDLEPDYIIRKPLVHRIPRYILRMELLSTFHTRVDRRSLP